MDKFKVAILQLASEGIDQEINKQKGELFCREAKELGAHIALFPEMWNIGYRFPKQFNIPIEEWKSKAIDKKSDFILHFQNLAKELDMAICITYLERDKNDLKNSLSIIDRHGLIVLEYSKVHTCDFGFEAILTPGDDFHVCNLDIGFASVKIGTMICFDREFPESARILMLKGAEIILVPNACELDMHRVRQLESRAFENMVGIATANYVWPSETWNSVAFDAMAFDDNGKSVDTLIIETDKEEGVYIAEFDIEKLRKYRQEEVWGNAYRKTRCYEILTNQQVEYPFIRDDAKK